MRRGEDTLVKLLLWYVLTISHILTIDMMYDTRQLRKPSTLIITYMYYSGLNNYL